MEASKLGEDLSQFIRTAALQILHDCRNRLGRANVDEKMNMVFHDLHCFDLKSMPLGKRKKYTAQLHSYIAPTKHSEPLVRCEHHQLSQTYFHMAKLLADMGEKERAAETYAKAKEWFDKMGDIGGVKKCDDALECL